MLSPLKLLTLLLFISFYTYSQVYDYLPMSYNNIETNPSCVASKRNKFNTNLTHINNFRQENNFSFNNFNINKYLENIYSGIGLSVSNTNLYDSLRYNHIGLSYAYRNIIFDKVYVKLGINYKFIETKAPKGYFTKYNYQFSDSIITKTTTQNCNIALSFTSSREYFYLTLGMLNINPLWIDEENIMSEFPEYQYVKIGNFWNFIDAGTSNELSVLVIREKYNGLKQSFTFYATFYRKLLTFNRKTYLSFGGDIGYKDNSNIIIKPSILIVDRIGGFLILKISTDIAAAIDTKDNMYKPAYLFSLMYKY